MKSLGKPGRELGKTPAARRHLLEHEAEGEQAVVDHVERQHRDAPAALSREDGALGEAEVDDLALSRRGRGSHAGRGTGPGPPPCRTSSSSSPRDRAGAAAAALPPAAASTPPRAPAPSAVTKPIRSPSTLRAAPRSAPKQRVSVATWRMLATVGAGGWANSPVGSALTGSSVQPSDSRKRAAMAPHAPLVKSTATRKRRSRIGSRSRALERCSR